jgi:hypothetical protein
MKSIQTQYRDYLFRSRLEARYAVFLDFCHEKWDYEAEGYDLDDGDRYLPDFWLPRLKCFLEVKAQYPNKREIRVCRKLQFHTGNSVAICHGLPTENEGLLFGFSNENGGMLTEDFTQWAVEDGGLALSTDTEIVCHPVICDAARAAKQARFEHNQYPRIYGSRRYGNSVDYENLPF